MSVDWCAFFAEGNLFEFCIREDRSAIKIPDLAELFTRSIAVCIPILKVVLVVSTVHGEMLVATAPLLMSLPLVFIDLLSNRMSDWQHELCSKSQVRAQALCEVLRRVVRIVDIPLELIPQYDVANPHVQLDDFHELAIHLLVLPEVVDLLPHASHDLILEDGWQIVLLHEYLCKALKVQVWLVFVPQEHVLQPFALELQVEFDGNRLKIWLAIVVALVHQHASWIAGIVVHHLLVKLDLVVR